jgi:hypothetical protein
MSETMKQLYFLPFFLLLSSAIFSQQKFEFGFAVKAGTPTLPFTKTRQDAIKSGWQLGFTSQYGVYGKRRMGERLFLSAEILYQFAQATKWDKVSKAPDDFLSPVSAKAATSVWENNLLVPLNLHFQPLKWEKTSLHLGVAAAFLIRSEVSSTFEGYPAAERSVAYPPPYVCDCAFGPPYTVQEISVYQSSKQTGNTQVFLGSGIQRRLSEYTSIGAELLISLRDSPSNCRLFMGWDCCAPVLGYSAASRYPIAMRSLSISLYHNILR